MKKILSLLTSIILTTASLATVGCGVSVNENQQYEGGRCFYKFTSK
ncbi:hypothetical protein STAIW_v1c07820 [Spiroplasma taiwanense CT-1]|uniref:Lipoprotein n=1 Tax=Spiroplasma taiwanense CT-1 TaxID=1276220 RepID=S5MCB4_9MOLU|nr:hypothetical protein STAIW_v1c07820 [Spiroplasma taiwanense CT-1]